MALSKIEVVLWTQLYSAEPILEDVTSCCAQGDQLWRRCQRRECVSYLRGILQLTSVRVIHAELKALVASMLHSGYQAGRSCNADSQCVTLQTYRLDC